MEHRRDGEARYTASVVYEGITYTDIQNAVIPATLIILVVLQIFAGTENVRLEIIVLPKQEPEIIYPLPFRQA